MGRRTKPRRARDRLKRQLEAAQNEAATFRGLVDAGLAVIERQREESNQFRASVAMDRGLMRDMRRSMDELQGAVDATACVLGPHFIGLPAAVVGIGDFEIPPLWRMEPRQDLSGLHAHAHPRELHRALADLPTYRGGAMLDQYRAQLHITLRNNQGDLAYTVDRMALAALPAPLRTKRLVEEFARTLSGAIEKALREGKL